MYTLYGLELAAKQYEGKDKLPVGYFKDALANLTEYTLRFENGKKLLKETFNEEYAFDIDSLKSTIRGYEQLASEQSYIEIGLFLELLQLAHDTLEKEQAFHAYVYEQIDDKHFKRIEPKYFVLKPNAISVHKVAIFEYPFENFITVYHESDDYYKGNIWQSHFVEVKYAKDAVRELTEEEKRQYTIS